MTRRLASIRRSLFRWYRTNGRRELPWRLARNPYHTVVSEFMLQQTQVDRAARLFESFVARFPDFAALARASGADVLRAWQGLGYNSRALRLRAVAESVVVNYGGRMPAETAELRALPGIGPYTASAIRAFAFDLDDAPVDTNVRRIVRRLFFGIEPVPAPSARELDGLAQALLPSGQAHDWSSAMMDLGATICTARAPQCAICPVAQSCAAAPVDAVALELVRKRELARRAPSERLPFAQTTRFARGRIVDRLRELPAGRQISLLDLHRSLEPLLPGRSPEELHELVSGLVRDGLVARRGQRIALPD
jgi:A/G-specific adenine glycosylase